MVRAHARFYQAFAPVGAFLCGSIIPTDMKRLTALGAGERTLNPLWKFRGEGYFSLQRCINCFRSKE
jgi:hypothetical protein